MLFCAKCASLHNKHKEPPARAYGTCDVCLARCLQQTLAPFFFHASLSTIGLPPVVWRSMVERRMACQYRCQGLDSIKASHSVPVTQGTLECLRMVPRTLRHLTMAIHA